MDEIFVSLSKFDRMVIWCTYPELTLEEIEIIEELMTEDYSSEAILEIMELEDRSESMQEMIDTLCQLTQDRWDDLLTERIIDTMNSAINERYQDLKNIAWDIQHGEKVLTKRTLEGKVKTWNIFKDLESAYNYSKDG